MSKWTIPFQQTHDIVPAGSHTKEYVTQLAVGCICSLFSFCITTMYCLMLHGKPNVDMQRGPSIAGLFAVFAQTQW